MARAPIRALLELAAKEANEEDLDFLTALLHEKGLHTAADWRAAFFAGAFDEDLEELYAELTLEKLLPAPRARNVVPNSDRG